MWKWSAFLALVLSGLAAVGARAESRCTLVKYAELPVTMVGLRPVIAAGVNGHPAYFILDSGAAYSVISPDAAAKLGLRVEAPPARLAIYGVGGRMNVEVTTVHQFQVGRFAFTDIDFLTGTGPLFEGQIVGALSQNFFADYDVEYDLANGIVRLFKPDGACSGAGRVYWAKSWSEIDLDHAGAFEPQLSARVVVNGRRLHATFDTGASYTILSLKAAAAAGLTPQSRGVAAAGVTSGFGPRRVDSWAAPITSFTLGTETISNTRVQMAGIDLNGEADLLIGADFFLAHRIYVAAGQRKLYFTYNGGPVFNLDAPGAERPHPDREAPADAQDLVRRAAASMARHDYVDAVADFSRAIALEPGVARHFHDRALAHIAAKDPDLALVDLDQALKLQPNDAESLMLRADLYLDRRETAKASADFDAALAQPDSEPTARLTAAESYVRVHLYADAIHNYDRWIVEHPRHLELAEALGGRCRARAEWGQGLDLALADCDASLKLRPRTAAVLDSRGLVLLRLGRPDEAIAAYDAALKAQPKLAWSLYARGLAERAKGMGPAGEADMAAGLALDATLAARARQIGLVPDQAAVGAGKPTA